VNTVSLHGIIVPIWKGEAEMAKQRVPNLQELDEQEAYRFLTELFPPGVAKRFTRPTTPMITSWRCPSQEKL
jgi:hypothetical protein